MPTSRANRHRRRNSEHEKTPGSITPLTVEGEEPSKVYQVSSFYALDPVFRKPDQFTVERVRSARRRRAPKIGTLPLWWMWGCCMC